MTLVSGNSKDRDNGAGRATLSRLGEERSGSFAIAFGYFIGLCLLAVAVVGGKSVSPAMKPYVPPMEGNEAERHAERWDDAHHNQDAV